MTRNPSIGLIMQILKERINSESRFYWIVLSLAFLSIVLQLFSTTHGIGLSPDSVVYIGSARSMVVGQGLNTPFYNDVPEPMTNFPPLYPLVLSAVGTLGIDPMISARWMGALVFGLLVVLIGASIYLFSNRSIRSAVTGSLLAALAPSLLIIHSNAWSEPLFILLGYSGILFSAGYFQNGRKYYLLLHALLSCFAFLTRYAGISFIAFGIWVLLRSRFDWGKKAKSLIIYCLITVIPMLLWMTRTFLVTGKVANRSLNLNLITTNHLIPALYSPVFISSVLLLLTVLLLMPRKRNNELAALDHYHPFLPLLSWFPLFYLLTILVSIIMFDAYISLEDRILTPGYVGILIVCFSWIRWPEYRFYKRWISALLIIVLFCSSALFSTIWVLGSIFNGIGYSSVDWKQSQTIQFVKEMPETSMLYSNAPDAIYILTGRHAGFIPQKFSLGSLETNHHFLSDVELLRVRLFSSNAYIVYFDQFLWRNDLPSEEELMTLLPLVDIYHGTDGRVFKHDDSK